MSGVRSVAGESFNMWEAVGGVRGVIEANAPAIIFVVLYTVTGGLGVPLVAALAFALLATLIRIFQHLDTGPALAGLFTTALSTIWAWHSGQPANYFALGLILNIVYCAILLLSVLVRHPLVGYIIGFLRDDAAAWRTSTVPEGKTTRRRYTVVTWMWAGLFALRVAVQGPLYLGGLTAALGVAKVIMGPFLYGGVLWLSWLLVRDLPPVDTYLHPYDPDDPVL